VQTALTAIASIGTGNVSVTGGPGPGTPWTVTFLGAKAYTNVAQMTATGSFTGGSSPAVAVSTVTDGINGTPAPTVTNTCRPTLAWGYNDIHNLAQAKWQLYVFTQTFANAHTMTDPSVWASSALVSLSGTNPSQRGVVPRYDYANGNYIFYIRAQNDVGLWSSWASYAWTQSVSPPPPPTGLSPPWPTTQLLGDPVLLLHRGHGRQHHLPVQRRRRRHLERGPRRRGRSDRDQRHRR
jgi:hypothetical protein